VLGVSLEKLLVINAQFFPMTLIMGRRAGNTTPRTGPERGRDARRGVLHKNQDVSGAPVR